MIDIAGGGYHSLALSKSGQLWGWGDGSYGQCGRTIYNLESQSSFSPYVILDHSVSSIAAGVSHSACIKTNGDLYTWGWGLYYQLGHGSVDNEIDPKRVEALQGVGKLLPNGLFTGILKVDCGGWHTAAISTLGDVYTWGWGKDKQLGSDSTMERYPHLVDLTKHPMYNCEERISNEDAIDVRCGIRQTLIQSSTGRIYAFGFPQAFIEKGPICLMNCGNWHSLMSNF